VCNVKWASIMRCCRSLLSILERAEAKPVMLWLRRPKVAAQRCLKNAKNADVSIME